MSVALTYDFSGVERLADRISRLARPDRRGLLDAVGATVESQVRRRIESEKESPEGGAWPQWSAKYAEKRGGQHSLLVGEGHLEGSITHAVSGDTAEIGGNLIYEATHQFGDEDRGIPARAHLGVSGENRGDIEEIIDRFFARVLQ